MRRRTSLAATLGVVACGLLGLTNFAEAGKIDAVAGASLKVAGGTSTVSTATLNGTFKYDKANWRIYYDIVDHTTATAFPKSVASPTTVSSTAYTFNLTGLTSGTKYFYWIQISDPSGKEKTANFHTTKTFFTTDVPAGIVQQNSKPTGTTSQSVDPLGRRTLNRGPIQIDRFGATIDLNDGHR